MFTIKLCNCPAQSNVSIDDVLLMQSLRAIATVAIPRQYILVQLNKRLLRHDSIARFFITWHDSEASLLQALLGNAKYRQRFGVASMLVLDTSISNCSHKGAAKLCQPCF